MDHQSTPSTWKPPPQTPYDDPYRPPAAQLIPGFSADLGADNASRGQRFAGAIVDNLLQVAAMLPGIVALIALGEDGNEPLVAMGLMLVGALAISIYQWYLVATTGQSLAKRWLGMKVVKVDGSDVDFVSGVVMRSWVPGFITAVLNAITGFGGAIDALFIFGREHRCLHDYIAGTRVINVGDRAADLQPPISGLR